MSEVTRILSAIERGDARAAEQLLPLVYEELRALAAQRLAHEKPGQTLQATALVHDAQRRNVEILGAAVGHAEMDDQEAPLGDAGFGALADLGAPLALQHVIDERSRLDFVAEVKHVDRRSGLHARHLQGKGRYQQRAGKQIPHAIKVSMARATIGVGSA